jgi:predicted amidohydrolase YtcJ
MIPKSERGMKMIRTFVNGKIFTSDPSQWFADAMVVKNGKIMWIGKQEELQEVQGECIDLLGRRVLPGLIDSHMHPLKLADTSKQISCTLPTVKSIQDIIEQIRRQRQFQKNQEWILCWGYDEGKLSEVRSPTRWDLDEATMDTPVMVKRTCAHISVVNSIALEIAGIDKDMPDPPGGEIERDENGEPTGILKEKAQNLFQAYLPQKTEEEKIALLTGISETLLSYGITSVTDMRALNGYYELYHAAREKGYKQRTVLYYSWVDNNKYTMQIEGKTNRNDPIFIGGVKVFGDGSISGKTAWIKPGYYNDIQNFGISVTSETELLEAAEYAKQNNIQLSVHAMGEQACDLVIDTFYEHGKWLDEIPSIRLEHAAMLSEHAVKRANKAGIAFSTQSIFIYAEIESYIRSLGLERTQQTYPIQTMLDEDVMIALSSDAPSTAWSEPANPFVAMKAAITRVAYEGTDVGQTQRIDVSTSIMLYTHNAKKITGIPDVGQLATGYWADFIILDQDILSIAPENIDQVQVLETYMSGEQVFKK